MSTQCNKLGVEGIEDYFMYQEEILKGPFNSALYSPFFYVLEQFQDVPVIYLKRKPNVSLLWT